MSIKITVVVPTFNSKALVQQCLHSLEKQTAPLSSFEVIVVDDGSNDGTIEMLNEFKKQTPLNLKSQYISNSGPATARNKGVALAQSDWVAMLDADVHAHNDWIKRALELIDRNPDFAGFEGRTIISDRHKLTPFTHQTENFYGGRYPTCNMVVRKEFCHFNTKYRIPFREDTDLAFSLIESGYKILFDSKLKVFHPPLSSNYSRPFKLGLRYYYDGLLKRRFPRLYKSKLDAHILMGIPISHIKKKLFGLSLFAQFVFAFTVLTQPFYLFEFFMISLVLVSTYLLTFWTSIRFSAPGSNSYKDLTILALINVVMPWVMYAQLVRGLIHFRHEQPFDPRTLTNPEALSKRKSHGIVVISTADWDHPFWTNKQHVASRLAKEGHKVLYVESLGLRKIAASVRDFKRIFQRTRRSLLFGRNVQRNLWVWSPLVIPLHQFASIRKLNEFLLSVFIKYFCRKFDFESPILWSYNPTIGPLAKSIDFSKHIYHCVDELSQAPGMPVELLESQEKQYCEQVDVIFTTSINLYNQRKKWNSNTYYLPNPCEFEHFNQAMQNIKIAPLLERIPEPRIGFIGALSNYKVSVPLLKKLAESHPEWQVVLLGQIGEGEPGSSFDDLIAFENIHFLGPQPYEKLPHYLKGFQVATLPCPYNGYTDNMFPLKFFEYLASGVPVVTTAIPALEEYKNVCHWCKTDEEFIDSIARVLKGKNKKRIEQGVRLAKENTWDKRVESMLDILDEQENNSKIKYPVEMQA